jgi:hypothetical protein
VESNHLLVDEPTGMCIHTYISICLPHAHMLMGAPSLSAIGGSAVDLKHPHSHVGSRHCASGVRAKSLSFLLGVVWFSTQVKLGYSRPLEAPDLWKLDPADRAARNEQLFAKLWQEERRKPNPCVSCVGSPCFGCDLVCETLWIMRIMYCVSCRLSTPC